jgi:hypothetical protein
MAKIISVRLEELEPYRSVHIETNRMSLIEDFTTLSEDASADVVNFNDLMNELYDWGDMWIGTWRVCWIATF